MVLQNLDRTQWTFAEAYAYVEGVVLSCQVEKFTDAMSIKAPLPSLDELPAHWLRAQKVRAREQVLVTLHDGDLHAQGRLSTTAAEPWHSENGLWRLHSGHHKPISPTEWLEGEFNWADEKLTASEWEFIDIRLPRFMVRAIWPDYVVPADVRNAVEETAYSPPYLDLMDAAIAHFHLSDAHQEKKEVLVEWFLGKQVEGAQISGNLAGAMATLVRLPSAQKGGAKRSWVR